MDNETKVRRQCHHDGHLFGGIAMILIGTAFLLAQFNEIPIWRVFATYWPVLIIAIGAMKLFRLWTWRRDLNIQH